MLQGIGIDIIETERFRTLENKDAFLMETFTKTEIEQGIRECDPDKRWATLFACKEAVLKACAIGLHYGSFWLNITLDHDCRAAVIGGIQDLLEPSDRIYVTRTCSRRLAIGCALIHRKEAT